VRPRGLLKYQAVASTPLPPEDWDVEPLFAQGDRVVMYGDFGALKSWVVLDLAIHLARGRGDWLGWKIPRSRKVLFIDEEETLHELQRRVRKLALGRGWEGEDLPLRLLHRPGFAFGPRGTLDLVEYLRGEDWFPEVVIVETLSMTLDGNEADNAAVNQMWRRAGVLVEAGATVLITHHMNKPGWGPASHQRPVRHQIRGATSILAGCDAGYAVQRTLRPQVSTLTGVKCRGAKLDAPVTLQLVDVGEGVCVQTLTPHVIVPGSPSANGQHGFSGLPPEPPRS